MNLIHKTVKLFNLSSFQIKTVHRSFSKINENQEKLMRRGLPQKQAIVGVNKIVLVASGKGGVGKSTTAVNLALALSKLSIPISDKDDKPGNSNKKVAQVGLLDADIYGPSIPKLMNLDDEEALVNENNQIIPIENYGLKVMSMGFLLNEKDSAIVWRGLMVMSAIQKLLRQVAWAPLDILVIDMPPGTGDVQLSISQNVPVDGAIIVSTPQQVALVDAHKGAHMFTKVQVPLLGFVENMSYFICPCCSHRSNIFSPSDAMTIENLAEKFNTQLLASIPLQQVLCDTSDNGQPIVVSQPKSEIALEFNKLAQGVLQGLYPNSTFS